MISIATSLVTLLGMWLVSRKDWRGWAVGLANQVLWLWLIIDTHSWGLLILMASLIFVYTKALIAWRRDEKEHRPAEVMLTDETTLLREALEAAVTNSTVFMVRLQHADPPDRYYELGMTRHRFAYDVLHGIEDHNHG